MPEMMYSASGEDRAALPISPPRGGEGERGGGVGGAAALPGNIIKAKERQPYSMPKRVRTRNTCSGRVCHTLLACAAIKTEKNGQPDKPDGSPTYLARAEIHARQSMELHHPRRSADMAVVLAWGGAPQRCWPWTRRAGNRPGSGLPPLASQSGLAAVDRWGGGEYRCKSARR